MTLAYTFNDASPANGQGSGGSPTATGTTTVNITAVNDGPVNTVPGTAPTVVEDTLTALTGFSVSDIDAAAQDIVVTLSVTSGSINLLTNVASGITAGDVANNGTGTVTITATQSEINTTFGASGLRYQGGQHFNGTATLTMTTNDQGFTGTGALQDQDTRTITVTAVNDAPVLANLGGTVTTNEQTAVLLDINALVSDADLDALNGGAGSYTDATLTIARSSADAQDFFGFDTAGAAFTVSGTSTSGNLLSGASIFATYTNSGGTLLVTFTGSSTAATSALADNVIQHITYTNTSDTPPASVTLTYTFNDASPANGQGSGASATATGTTTVNITAVNDAPVNTVPGAQSVAPGIDLVFGTGNGNAITFADLDAGGGDLTVKLEVEASATLTLGSTAGVVIDPAHLNGTNSVWITGTLAEITAALEGLKYKNSAPGGDTLTITINDGGNTPAPAQQDIDTIAITVVSPVTVDLDPNDFKWRRGAELQRPVHHKRRRGRGRRRERHQPDADHDRHDIDQRQLSGERRRSGIHRYAQHHHGQQRRRRPHSDVRIREPRRLGGCSECRDVRQYGPDQHRQPHDRHHPRRWIEQQPGRDHDSLFPHARSQRTRRRRQRRHRLHHHVHRGSVRFRSGGDRGRRCRRHQPGADHIGDDHDQSCHLPGRSGRAFVYRHPRHHGRHCVRQLCGRHPDPQRH